MVDRPVPFLEPFLRPVEGVLLEVACDTGVAGGGGGVACADCCGVKLGRGAGDETGGYCIWCGPGE